MPLLSLAWVTIILLSIFIYTLGVLYKKDLNKYKHHFAIGTFIICAFVAASIDITLRKYSLTSHIKQSYLGMPTLYDTYIFYVKYAAIYFGLYGLSQIVKAKVAKIIILVSIFFCSLLFYKVHISQIKSGYSLYSHFKQNTVCPKKTGSYSDLAAATINLSGFPIPSIEFWPRIFEILQLPVDCPPR